MKFDEFFEILIEGVDAETADALRNNDVILLAYNTGHAEGVKVEQERQYKLRYEKEHLIEVTNDFLASTKPLEGDMLALLDKCFEEGAKTKPTLPNRL